MIANQRILSDTGIHGVLAAESYISPEHGRHKREVTGDLLLTALIDAFSILVIFLLMSFSSTGELLFIPKDQELPKAHLAEVLERNPVVKIDGDKLYVEEKEIKQSDLIMELMNLRKAFAEIRPGM